MNKIVLVCLVLVCSLLSMAQTSVTVGPYLQSPTPTGIKVMWRTDSLSTVKVMYGTSLTALNLSTTDTTFSARHTVELKNLTPYTKYFYSIYNGNNFAEGADSAHWFRTFPVAGSNTHVRAWVIGDFGKGNEKQQKVRDSFSYFDSTETNLWIWLGDNVYQDGTEEEYLTKVFDSVYGYKKIMKHLPFEPSPGNHDYNSIAPIGSSIDPLQHTGPYYDLVEVYKNAEAGGVPTGHELFYSYDYGNTHFVSLNSEVGSLFNAAYDWTGVNLFSTFTSSPMTDWLHQDLQANTKPWVVVYFHQPPYSDGSHDSGAYWELYMRAMRQNFAEIWEQYGVDLVLCGHSHVYERSFLVKGAYEESADINVFNFIQNTSGRESLGEAYTKYTQGFNPNQGTIYTVCGNSGSSDEAPQFNHPYMYSEYGCDTCCGSFVLDIDSNKLVGRHIDTYGKTRDDFTIYKVFGENPNAINEVTKDAFNLNVAPNPFDNSTTLRFELKKAEKVTVRMMDITGKTINVFEGNLQSGKQELEINAEKLKIAKGVYTLQMATTTLQTSRKVVFQ